MVGRIWYRHMHRPDLAETRYEHALAIDPKNLGALNELESIHRLGTQPRGLARDLERQFDVYERRGTPPSSPDLRGAGRSIPRTAGGAAARV